MERLRDQEIVVRSIKETDLKTLWTLIYKEENPEWKLWDAPYYEHHSKSYKEFLSEKNSWIGNNQKKVVEINNRIVGTVSYYWEHQPSKWLEMGITIYKQLDREKGYGTRILKLWIQYLFDTLDLVRIGYTTWSGNYRMIHIGEKLGMTMEGRLRKVRYWDGIYYDSIRMGILREEWKELNK
ncbi:GNAT family N-acetyltransferase [Marinilactibacillus psychrotolerans]|uniref:GNAT family N-acetyltransferase n=2 Tax=Marinilactibacillus psychrotolerans TaxID=191770 RepID=A0A5R9C599_9LACT|nr:GNAT family protein [Marinilactibacillus psychrotolerans]TLQ08151.1 GNAT family N-acetyltransferase [Marinilactibacillus psychrotolerans]GEQ32429.1 GNAT family acetyltransferase [Marinilactibacillus psychrotolerans]SJN44280.1 acetyltransferase, GNAT family [Marinilactibacillus psychrotolerans 42ea]